MPRPSNVEKLPDDIREKLQELLRDPRVTQMEVAERINAILEEEGHEERVSKSSVNRYAVRMEKVGEKLRQSREMADMWIAKIGAQPQGQMGHLINEMLRTVAYEVSSKLAEDELTADSMPDVIAQLKDLALTASRLEKASSENVKRESEIRRQAREEAAQEAAQAAESAGRRAGLSDDGVASLRSAILEEL